jgi:hypothetical protein
MFDPIAFSWNTEATNKLLGYVKTVLQGEDDTKSREINPAFGKYITRNSGFTEELDNVREILRSYAARSGAPRPINILLAAEPGTGKSFLIKQLSEALGLDKDKISFEEVYVGALRNVEDLYGVFQRVQSANLNGKLPFVMFDEIDSTIEGKHVFADFLAPMWDGHFYVGKEKFALGKAVFAFAGSKITENLGLEDVIPRASYPNVYQREAIIDYSFYAERWISKFKDKIEAKNDDEGTQKVMEKVKDFVDRVDVILCMPPIDTALLSARDVGQEYLDLACVLLKKHFPGVTCAERSALVVLAKLLTSTSSRRTAEKCVFCSSAPADNCFRYANLPRSEQNKRRKDPDVNNEMSKYLSFDIRPAAAPVAQRNTSEAEVPTR